ncbi:hypothetical protein [Burkholderia cepacia]|uniref:hypothetical protein n=1 Tax=Burkholderia cepacia TaxID=292 RepID=UPI00075731CF|nr:hypothetical protein [Burkholderia cepacia]KVX59330.1 hypothetical protein WL06_05870 [Burkholderia cepacia]KWD63386.1 hypothetical protein WL68_00465 [Burkholderia cepacia]KWD84420.1 hypothetical protein WL69_12750 [Burkholderia cepacia]
MKLFQPQIQVRLIKARPRAEVVNGKRAAASRYGANFTGMDLTPYLSEDGPVAVNKSVREPAGAFSFTLVDRPNGLFAETLYAMIEPMDIIEIRMARCVADYQGQSSSGAPYRLPIVMRGFVTTVTRNRSIENGTPQRSITVSGHDYGKLLQIIRIFYNTLNGGYVANDILTGLQFYWQYASDGAPKIKDARTFLTGVINDIVNPYLAKLTSLQAPSERDVAVVKEFLPAVSVESVVSPLSVSAAPEGSVYDFLAGLLDVGPFNELYTEDTEDGVNLVLRPAPFKDYATGEFIDPDAWAESIVLPMGVVQSDSLSRTDANVANFFWVTNAPWQLTSNDTQRQLGNQGDVDSFYMKNYVNTELSIYGLRKMQASVSMAPPGYQGSDSPKAAQYAADNVALLDWLASKREFLALSNKDNAVLESGTIRVRGDEKIKAGMYVTIQTREVRDDIQSAGEFYVTGVLQEFQPYHGFFTTMTVERGTNFANRAQSRGTPYFDELDLGGIR